MINAFINVEGHNCDDDADDDDDDDDDDDCDGDGDGDGDGGGGGGGGGGGDGGGVGVGWGEWIRCVNMGFRHVDRKERNIPRIDWKLQTFEN